MDGRDELLGNEAQGDGSPLAPVLDDIARHLLYLSALATPVFLAVRLVPVLAGNHSAAAVGQLVASLLAIAVVVVAARYRERLDSRQIGLMIAGLGGALGLISALRFGANTGLMAFLFIALLNLSLFVGRRIALYAGVAAWTFAIAMTFFHDRDQFSDARMLMDTETGVLGVGPGLGAGLLLVIMLCHVLPKLLVSIEQNLLQRSEEASRRTHAEARSQRVEDQWRRNFDLAPLGLTLLDATGRVTAWNRTNEQYLGVSQEQITGTRLEDYLRSLDDRHPLLSRLANLYNGEAITDVVLDVASEEGIRSILINGAPILINGDQVDGAFLTGTDITPLIGEQGEAGNDSAPVIGRQSPLTKLANHLLEIRSALMGAGLSAETLVTSLSLPIADLRALQGRAQQLVEQQRSASALADAAFALITDKSEGLSSQDAVRIAEIAANILRNRAAEQGIAIELDDVFAEGSMVAVQSVLLRQILINLISNAREAIERSKRVAEHRITVKVMAEAETVVFMVEDTAGSVLPVNRDVYFNPSYSSKGDRSHSNKGLFVSRHTAERLGGSLDVEQGEAGLRFVLTLPRAQDA